MIEKIKGFRTFVFGIIVMIVGGLTGSGLLTPDVGHDLTNAADSVLKDFELLVGAIQSLVGIAIIAFRAVTNTSIFKKQ